MSARAPFWTSSARRGARRTPGAVAGVFLLALLIVPNLPLQSAGQAGIPSAVRPFGAAIGAPNPTALLGAVPAAGPRSAAPTPHVPELRPVLLAPTSGPHPYGVSDFGMTENGSTYRYATDSFLATADIGSMDASFTYHFRNRTGVIPGNTIQLNAILVLRNGSNQVAYWIQDVPAFGTPPGPVIDLEDNIWNMSAAGTLAAGSVVGNGSIQSGQVYITSADTSLPGNNVVLSYPTNVSVKIVTAVANGTPYVDFDYLDGFGWQTFDNATFPWARNGWVDDGFVVDGANRTGNGLYFDTEWVYAGPGNGIASDNLQSNLTMSLEFWNGHNYQAVTTAANIGFDTGESMYNVSETSGIGNGVLGIPSANLQVGLAQPEFLYGVGNISILNVSSPLPTGKVTVGSLSVPFVGRDANVTVGPGNYTVTLWNGSSRVGSRSVSLSAGEYLAINFSVRAPQPSNVSVEESGLPAGTNWTVTVNGTPYHVAGPSITFGLLNGTYGYVITPIPGYYLPSYRGVLTIDGAAVTLSVDWLPFLLPLTVSVSGLPSGVAWSIDLAPSGGGTGSIASVSAATPSTTVELQNGTYSYSVSVPYRWIVIPAAPDVSIRGGPAALTVSVSPRYAYLVGTVSPASATIAINGTSTTAGASGAFNFTLESGEYAISVSAPGYSDLNETLVLTPGNLTSVHLALTAEPTTPTPRGNSSSGSSGGGSAIGGISDLVWTVVIAAAIVAGAIAALARRPKRPAA